MDFTYLETAMAFFGLASIVIGSFATALRSIYSESHKPNARAANHSN